MLLTIVIPVYNTAAYLEACVQSVLSGDHQDCEILLVDDGSTDGVCPALCDRLAAQHPALIRVIHQENKGQGGARNTGLEAAAGAYLFFLDSDDTIVPEALSAFKTAIARTHAEVLAFNFFSDDGAGHLTPMSANYAQYNGSFTIRERPEFLLSLPAPWGRIWSRDLFLRSGIRFPSRVWYEDLRASVKLLVAARSIVTLPDHLYRYLQRPGSTMHSGNTERCREILLAFDDLLDWFQAEGILEPYRNILCRLCVDHAYLAASVRVLLDDPTHPLLGEIQNYLLEHFPNYRQNPYLQQLPASRKLAFRLLERRHYRLLRLLFRTKDKLM